MDSHPFVSGLGGERWGCWPQQDRRARGRAVLHKKGWEAGGEPSRACCAPWPSASSAPGHSWLQVPLRTWHNGWLALPERKGGPLDPRDSQELGPWPAGTIRPNCLVPALRDPALGCSSDPDGGKAFPNLSSVIRGKLIFTKQSPKERGGHEKLGTRRLRT